tara:strand:- start:742 stop:1005 length:264 start_codon:yes stop_codon:yes gene_type:complete
MSDSDNKRFIDAFEKHTEHDDKRFESIEGKLDVIKDNHLAHIQNDMQEQTTKLTATTTNVDWLMRFFWIIATASIGGLITGVLNLLK